jgi:hypothetical protein
MFKASDLTAVPPGSDHLATQDLIGAFDEASLAEDEALESMEVGPPLAESGGEEDGFDSDEADIAFVGDALAVGDQLTGEEVETAPSGDGHDDGEDLVVPDGDSQWWHEGGLLGSDTFTFHPEGDEAPVASEVQPEGTGDMDVFVWVCESEEPEVAPYDELADSDFDSALSVSAQNVGNELL